MYNLLVSVTPSWLFSMNVCLQLFFYILLTPLFVNTTAGAEPYLTGIGFAQYQDLRDCFVLVVSKEGFGGQAHCWGLCVRKYRNKGTEYIFTYIDL